MANRVAAVRLSALMGMPSAKGMFHRAAIQSGGGGAGSPEEAREFARQMFKELAIAPNDISCAAEDGLGTTGQCRNGRFGEGEKCTGCRCPFFPVPEKIRRHNWGPSLDGHIITMSSFQDAAPEISKDVPLLVGSVSEEGTAFHLNPTEAEWEADLSKVLGAGRGQALAAAMKKAHPEKSIRTLSYGTAGVNFRNMVVRMAKMKSELNAAQRTSTSSAGKRRCLKVRARGTRPISHSASTTHYVAHKPRATRPRRRHWPGRWRMHGRILPAPATRASRDWNGLRLIRPATRPWFGITIRAWLTIPRAKRAKYFWNNRRTTQFRNVQSCHQWRIAQRFRRMYFETVLAPFDPEALKAYSLSCPEDRTLTNCTG